MDAISYLREDMRITHEWLEQTMQDVTQEQLDWHPPGIANPLGASYAHALLGEDGAVNQLLRGDLRCSKARGRERRASAIADGFRIRVGARGKGRHAGCAAIRRRRLQIHR